MVRLVFQINHHRQLLFLHLRSNLLKNLGTGNLIWQCGNDNLAIFFHVGRAGLHGSATGAVHFFNFRLRGDDLRFSGKIRTLDVLADVLQRCFGVIEQMDQRLGNFMKIVRWNVCRHPHSNPATAVKQHIRQPCRQHFRFVQCAVEIRLPFDRALA